MKRLTIYTADHEELLRNFASELDMATIKWGKWQNKNRLFSMCLIWDNDVHNQVVDNISIFLQDVATLENSIYKHSPKLQEMAKSWQLTPAQEHETRRLKAFLKQSRILHIEGYITFRMAEYRTKLDIMSYRAIKKLKLTQKD